MKSAMRAVRDGGVYLAPPSRAPNRSRRPFVCLWGGRTTTSCPKKHVEHAVVALRLRSVQRRRYSYAGVPTYSHVSLERRGDYSNTVRQS